MSLKMPSKAYFHFKQKAHQSCPIFLSLFVFLMSASAWTQIPTPEDMKEMKESELPAEVRKMFREIWSPYCPGQSLYECASIQSHALRNEIARKYKEGKTPEQIVAELQDIFGPKVSMIPQAKGFSLTTYLTPVFVFIFALAFYGHRMFRRGRPSAVAPSEKNLSAKESQDLSKWLKS